MPGFLTSKRNQRSTSRIQSFRDGMAIVTNANSNNSMVTNHLKKRTKKESDSQHRKKANSEAMYMSSASVPDSLIAFTNEIHMVS